MVAVDGLRGGGHVGALSYKLAASLHKGLGIVNFDLVLSGAGQGNVILDIHTPWTLPVDVLAWTSASKSDLCWCLRLLVDHLPYWPGKMSTALQLAAEWYVHDAYKATYKQQTKKLVGPVQSFSWSGLDTLQVASAWWMCDLTNFMLPFSAGAEVCCNESVEIICSARTAELPQRVKNVSCQMSKHAEPHLRWC